MRRIQNPSARKARLVTYSLALMSSCFVSNMALGQQKATAPNETDIVTLSPFEVNTSTDVGYQAGNTLSGSRLDTSLKDTAAAVHSFTKEFLADFRLSNLDDMTAYAPNVMIDIQDRTPAATPSFLGGANTIEGRIRARGLPVSPAFDFFETLMPTDSYRAERFELAVGPNSILFGFANPGGLYSTTTKKADFLRTRSAIETEFGTWDRSRYTVDHNQVLIPKKLALRVYHPGNARFGPCVQ